MDHHPAKTAFQILGAVSPLVPSLTEFEQPFGSKCMSSIPAIVVAASFVVNLVNAFRVRGSLRCDALTAPFVIDAPMDRRIFETYVETQLAPTLSPGDVVVLDNLPAHKSAAAEQAVRARGAGLLFLPPYSPDLNPIEMAFAKLKALLRARAVRTIDALWRAIGQICDLFSPQERQNYFHAAGGKQRQALSTGCLEQVDSETFSVGSLLIALTEKLTRSMVA